MKTYKDCGVNIQEGNDFVSYIEEKSKRDLKGFCGVHNVGNLKLAVSTDGIGTKIKLACKLGKYDTLGIDLVAMCVNDLITIGAKPLFFLDYFGTNKLDSERDKQLIDGIIEGCRQADCLLIGGETAEMPDFYQKNYFDLAGFVVGQVDKEINGNNINENDVIIGIAASGLHSNGYSVINAIFKDKSNDYLEQFLTPTIIYKKLVDKVLKNFEVKGMAHITGGGLYENISRIIPKGYDIDIDYLSWEHSHVYFDIRNYISIDEMFRVFNMGIGYVFICNKEYSEGLIEVCKEEGYKAYEIGRVISI